MNDDTISRKMAIDAIKDADVFVFYDKETEIDDAIEIAIRSTKGSAVKNIEDLPSICQGQQNDNSPSVRPKRKAGEWLPDNNNNYDERYICSECKGNYKVDTCMGKPSWKYCPDCGSYNGG